MKVQYKKVFLLVTGIILILLAGGWFAYFCQKPQQDVKNILDNREKLTSIFEDQSVSSTEKMLQDVIPYKNDYLEIFFVYPRDYKDTQCDVVVEQNDEKSRLRVGSRVEMSVISYSESLLNVNNLVSSTLRDIQIETQKNIVVGGKKALQIGYRFGGMGRYGEITYVIHNKKLYTISFTAGAFECGLEPMVYEKMLETLQFDL